MREFDTVVTGAGSQRLICYFFRTFRLKTCLIEKAIEFGVL